MTLADEPDIWGRARRLIYGMNITKVFVDAAAAGAW